MTKGLIIHFFGILMSFSLESSSAEETAFQDNCSSQGFPFKVLRMCEEYAKCIFGDPEYSQKRQCHPENLVSIVGGTYANQNEFPHMVHLAEVRNGRTRFVCGGSLISPGFVLSAAHCPSPTWARLGDNPDTYKYEWVVQTFRHPKFIDPNHGDDVALFKLEKDVPLSPTIWPICLPTEPRILNSHAIAIGWGDISRDGPSSRGLKKVFLKLVNAATCNAFYRTIDEARMVCAGGEIGQDTCQGDSGGPLQIRGTSPDCMYSIVGITSAGRGCGTDWPGVYTRVSYYVPWIRSIIEG